MYGKLKPLEWLRFPFRYRPVIRRTSLRNHDSRCILHINTIHTKDDGILVEVFFYKKTEERRCNGNSPKRTPTQCSFRIHVACKIFIYYNLRLMRHSVNAKFVLCYYNLCFKFASVSCFFFILKI